LPSPSVFFKWRYLSAKELDLLDWLMMNKSTEFDDDNKDGFIFWTSNERIGKLFPEVDIDELLEMGYLLSPITPDEFNDLERVLGARKLALLHGMVYPRKDVTCLSRQGIARVILFTKRPFKKETHDTSMYWFDPPPTVNNHQFVVSGHHRLSELAHKANAVSLSSEADHDPA